MWFFSIYKYIMFGLKKRTSYILAIHPICYIKLKVFFLKKFLHYFYVKKYNYLKKFFLFTLEPQIIGIKYTGKIFRIERKKKNN